MLHKRPQRRQIGCNNRDAHFDSGPQRDVRRVEEEVGRAEVLNIRHPHKRCVAGDTGHAQQWRNEQLSAALDVELPHGEAFPVAALQASPEEVDGCALEEGEEEVRHPG